ncbi:phosphotransferase family protein [Microlunatus sp. Gsoil 973]|uniref:phosphotransferase family protein n=1 Tax=Microlunatus sp. Gsoil 973 TaxID=2672569 RepID=UPI0018A87392|nr:aminoglycoside phosphotransferase family protein [Microlunatus sp. Gsoil 973]
MRDPGLPGRPRPSVREPRPTPQLSVAEVRAVAERALDTQVAELVEQPGSVGNQNFRLGTGRGRFALKLAADTEVAAERWGLEHAAAADVPVPHVVATGPLPDDRGFLITEWLDGRPADAEIDTDALIEAGRALRRFHRVTGSGYGRVDVTAGAARGRHESWDGFIETILAGMDDLLRHDVITASIAARTRAAVADHREMINYSGQGVLLHCDLKPAHLFVTGGRLAAIIDWGDTSFGDPRWDLARIQHSGDAVFTPVLDGYRHQDQEFTDAGIGPALRQTGAEFDRSIACLAAILRLDALHYELMAGGDWFDVYRSTIQEWLDSLAPATPTVEQP